ncbi:MAG: MBL fold metallo-hydrolase [Clostridia bacterium]|nr:MBL fold metallo-hydrolase [Clostridia bacterium]
MLKKALILLLLLCLSLSAAAEEEVIVNLLDNPDAPYAFSPESEVLEVIFPRVFSCDICFIRRGDEVMMLDAGSIGMRGRIEECMAMAGINRIDRVFISHPHDDHIGGLTWMLGSIPVGEITIAAEGGKHWTAELTDSMFASGDYNVRRGVQDGDLFSFGGADFRVFVRGKGGFSNNDRSAMLRMEYGARTMLFAADIEITAQGDYAKYPPEYPLQADILKYPHHGLQRMNRGFRAAVAPRLAVATAGKTGAKHAIKYLKQYGTPVLCTAGDAMLRLRTDGRIWVIDDLARDLP